MAIQKRTLKRTSKQHDQLWVEAPGTRERTTIAPGELRHRDVKVGQCIPISSPAVPRFVERYDTVYSKLGKTETILSAAAAIIGTGERQAPRVVSALTHRGVLTSKSTRAPLRLAFPASLSSR